MLAKMMWMHKLLFFPFLSFVDWNASHCPRILTVPKKHQHCHLFNMNSEEWLGWISILDSQVLFFLNCHYHRCSSVVNQVKWSKPQSSSVRMFHLCTLIHSLIVFRYIHILDHWKRRRRLNGSTLRSIHCVLTLVVCSIFHQTSHLFFTDENSDPNEWILTDSSSLCLSLTLVLMYKTFVVFSFLLILVIDMKTTCFLFLLLSSFFFFY